MPQLRQVPPVSINLKIGNVEVKSELHNELRVGNEDIVVHMDEVAAKFAYWGTLHATALEQEKIAKNELKTWMARKKKEVCSSGKFTSETAKEDAVLTNNVEEYAQVTKRVIESEYAREVLSVVKEAWAMKKDMLQSLGKQLIQERKDPSVGTPSVGSKDDWDGQF